MNRDGDESHPTPEPGEHRTPRWVKITGIIALIVVLVLLGVLLFGGGQHGPGRHAGAPDGADHGSNHTPPGGSNDHGGNHSPPGEARSGPRGPVTWTVEVQDDVFAPANLTIQAGDTLERVHVGSNAHTVTADDASFASHPDCNTFVDAALDNCMGEGDRQRQDGFL